MDDDISEELANSLLEIINAMTIFLIETVKEVSPGNVLATSLTVAESVMGKMIAASALACGETLEERLAINHDHIKTLAEMYCRMMEKGKAEMYDA